MVRSIRRGALAAVLALSLAPLAAACTAGSDAPTLQIRPNSAEGSAGSVKVQNAFVLTQPNGPASVTARLFNNGSTDQTLQSVQLAGGLSATLSGANGATDIVVPAHGSVLLGGQGNPTAAVQTGAQTLRDGDVQQAVFTFSGSGPVTLQISVSPAVGYLAPYGPGSLPTTAAPLPSPSATPTTGAPGSTPTTSPGTKPTTKPATPTTKPTATKTP